MEVMEKKTVKEIFTQLFAVERKKIMKEFKQQFLQFEMKLEALIAQNEKDNDVTKEAPRQAARLEKEVYEMRQGLTINNELLSDLLLLQGEIPKEELLNCRDMSNDEKYLRSDGDAFRPEMHQNSCPSVYSSNVAEAVLEPHDNDTVGYDTCREENYCNEAVDSPANLEFPSDEFGIVKVESNISCRKPEDYEFSAQSSSLEQNKTISVCILENGNSDVNMDSFSLEKPKASDEEVKNDTKETMGDVTSTQSLRSLSTIDGNVHLEPTNDVNPGLIRAVVKAKPRKTWSDNNNVKKIQLVLKKDDFPRYKTALISPFPLMAVRGRRCAECKIAIRGPGMKKRKDKLTKTKSQCQSCEKAVCKRHVFKFCRDCL